MCKCEQNSQFKYKLREAYSKNQVLWQDKQKEIVTGTKEQAELRLKNGTIECYFVPSLSGGAVSFETVLQSETVKSFTEEKPEAMMEFPAAKKRKTKQI
ncbi:hypothetical protein [Chryseobacterium sp. R2A-55]|uniref:hypothetical protein n=1 Tax=Chryseobacterium sp. R2A-55 TaxID=2744445 RepID=UPI001F3BA43C|nr:hypothetical protein [Chryseobacterium sp. R2A-55]